MMNTGLNNREMNREMNRENEMEMTAMTNNTQIFNVNNFKSRTQVALERKTNKEITHEMFMSKVMNDYGTLFKMDKNYGVGQITISSNCYNAILALRHRNPESFVNIATLALNNQLGNMPGFGEGTGKYEGLYVEKIKADKVDLHIINVNEEEELLIIKEIISCDLNDIDNLFKIMTDINSLFRFYQEMTIDAAKKLYKVLALFYTDVIKATSSMHIRSNFINFNQTPKISFERKGKYCVDPSLPLGEVQEFTNNQGETIYAFNDTLSLAQNAVTDFVASQIDLANAIFTGEAEEEIVNEDGTLTTINKEVKFSDETIASLPSIASKKFNMVKDVWYYICRVYNKVTADRVADIEELDRKLEKKEISRYRYEKDKAALDEYKANKNAELSNFARMMFADLSMEEAGEIMFAASLVSRTNDGGFYYNAKSTNQCYLQIAPEFATKYLIEKFGAYKKTGYRLYGDTNTLDMLEEYNLGQELEFKNGVCLDAHKVYVNSEFTGKLTIEIYENELCAVKDIEIKRVPFTIPNNIDLLVMKNNVYDPMFQAKYNKFANAGSFDVLLSRTDENKVGTGLLKKATKITLLPKTEYKIGKYNLRNAMVATVPSVQGERNLEIPFASYVSYSSLTENLFAGLVSNGAVLAINKDVERMLTISGSIAIITLKFKDQDRLDVEKNFTDNDKIKDFDYEPEEMTDANRFRDVDNVSKGGAWVSKTEIDADVDEYDEILMDSMDYSSDNSSEQPMADFDDSAFN